MTAVTVASFLQGASHPAHGDRRFLMSVAGSRGGVIPKTATFTDLAVTQRGAGANMSVDVAEGSCFVTGTESTYQGVYHGENQGVQNVPLTAANATNARKDLIVARIKDVEYGVAVTNAFSIEKIDGTAAASPVDPTVPDNCIVLARIAVAANATSITNANITDLRAAYTAVTGASVIGNQVKAATAGVIPCLSTFRPTKGLYEGMLIYETDTSLLRIYNGTTWITTRAAARCYLTAGVVLNSATLTNLTWGTTDFVRGGFAVVSGGLTVPVAGVYQVNGQVKMVPPASNGDFAINILRNGSPVAYGETVVTSNTYQGRTATDLVSCSAGDVIGLAHYWSGPSTGMQCDGPGQSNYLSACLVSP